MPSVQVAGSPDLVSPEVLSAVTAIVTESPTEEAMFVKGLAFWTKLTVRVISKLFQLSVPNP